MEELVGSTILDIEIDQTETYLKFTTDKGIIAYELHADCCSDSWFSEIINIDNLINQTVNFVEDLSYSNKKHLPDYGLDDGHCRQSSDIFYGFEIRTNKGTSTIVFRNSSNGYYGGSIKLCETHDVNSLISLKELTDWTAYEPTNKSYIHTLKLKAFL